MPINYKLYHPNWKDIIRPDILRRDNYKCKHCGVVNRTPYVYEQGKPYYFKDDFIADYYTRRNERIRKVVLTIAHLDHNRDNNEYSNLAALCQICHLKYDKEQHRISRITKKA